VLRNIAWFRLCAHTEFILNFITYPEDTGAFYFDNISAEDVALFFLKQTYKSLVFISQTLSRTMDVFCRAGSDQKAQHQLIWLKA